MTKSDSRECAKLVAMGRANLVDAATLARSYSAMIRATRSTASRDEIITIAAGFPGVVQHPEFIV
jgi:hypothetical protein